jgi:hypothetical protein
MWKQDRRRSGMGILGPIVGSLFALGLVAAAAVVGFNLLGKPFATETKDHSAPPVLLELRNIADFHAAEGRFEVTVDQEKDVKWLPSFIAGERVQFIGVGTVDAVVDFSSLNDGSVKISEDNTKVVVTLPGAYLDTPELDLETSHVMNRDRGLVNRVGGMFTDSPTTDQELIVSAMDKIAMAASATDLKQRAEDNTKLMLYSMLKSLGFEQVDIRFQQSSVGPSI